LLISVSVYGVSHVKKFLLTASLVSLVAMPGVAEARRREPPPPPPAPVQVAPTDPIELYYFQHQGAPIFTRSAESKAALPVLTSILRRARIEGLNEGPQLADAIDAAMARAASSNAPADNMQLEYAAGRGLVAYAQLLKKAPAGLLVGYPHMGMTVPRADQVLLTAAAAPSLALYLQKVANPSPTYSAIRDAGWKAMEGNSTAPVDPRLVSNLERARVLPAGGKYIMVNSADAKLTMVENGQPVDSMKVVVGMTQFPDGKPNYLPTPLISSMIYYVTFNPYWNVPQNLIIRNIGHKARDQGPSYLKGQGFEVMSDWTENATVVPYDQVDWKAVAAGTKTIRIRELPGPLNSMGRFKFNFRNAEDIYLHDTPMKAYMLKADRHLSNGCIRLEDARRLAKWLLQREPTAPTDTPETHVQIPTGVPVYVTYLTANVGADGKLAYLSDTYGWDGNPAKQLAVTASGVSRAE